MIAFLAKAQDDSDGKIHTYQVDHSVKSSAPNAPDSINLKTENNNAYYQKTFKVDSNIKVSTIYTRVLEFMAAKNFQQNYGYEQEGKLFIHRLRISMPHREHSSKIMRRVPLLTRYNSLSVLI